MKNVAADWLKSRTLLFDGAMGTMFYARGIFINRCYDELNLTEPEMVRELHEEYLMAGAEAIETNTFGATAPRLARYGLAEKVGAINRAAVVIAHRAVRHAKEKLAVDALVAGSIGPVADAALSEDEVRNAYREQMAALVEGEGIDLFAIETVMSLREARLALEAAALAAPGIPSIVMVTVNEVGQCLDGTEVEEAVRFLEAAGAAAVGCNCSSGPEMILRTIERMRAVTTLPIAGMPNAGVPSCVDGRSIYLTSPEYMASFARKALRAGATIVGGCCGTTPAHIRSMRGALRAVVAQQEGTASAGKGTKSDHAVAIVEPMPLAARSLLGGRIARKEFVTMVEIVPPKGIDASRELEGARMLHAMGVHAINVPDSPRASARMSAGALCIQIQQKIGVEVVLHSTCRDRNLLGLQSDLLGAASLGLKNMLCLTGDPPKMGTYPDATAVFDVDAIGQLAMAREMNRGFDIGGNSIGASTNFVLACAANPGLPDLDAEVRRFAAKVEAGAEFAITQPVFDLRLLEDFLRRIEQFRIPVIAGIWPLTSVRNAEFMRNDLKVSVPESIMTRMAACETPESAREEGILIAQEMLREARPQVQGVQVSAPFGKYELAAKVLDGFLSGGGNGDV
ncbi:bifunctional homocysteine S-methyltransferase/methylenetetrahydrofolate reductase [Terriglobus saanensis]|uniref:Homocysteine S-methyltransferase n=1 Tax=Terriglobus saanensis (strain ATCC BAA-1853 / DSM 23119 / SP1PR4) TaxID=401053 RepID=E8UZC6_TERSS|nr:bifunctional homocysteine S-methyltransferase/methylenetetrahydrofolate reductase [Terriglobus saanensis]ADV82144.1 homocysteine S-methyltransferase [Terriglobus saanensis SP1PR4]